MEENPLPSSSAPTPQPSQPQPTPPETSVTPSGFSLAAQPVTESLIRTQTEQQASAPFVPNTTGEEPKRHSGKMKWILIGAGVLVAGTAAGLYFGGFLTPAQQNTDQLNGAAIVTQETQETQEAPDVSNITQISLTACPQGQVMDPVSSRCGCDINNNYFPMNLAGAYTQPAAGQSLQCTTCSALSDDIIKLGQSQDPADATRKAELENLAKENNCTTCAVIDDRISKAAQDKTWDIYFNLVVDKSNDKTCGRSLTTCDSLKWQLLFMNDLRDKAGKDPQTGPEMLQTLKEKQAALAEKLGTNETCYNMQSLCTDLKSLYGTNQPIVPKQATSPTSISSTPLQGQTDPGTSGATQQTQQTQQDLSSTNPDLSKITLDQLFDREFYMLHCPVDGFSQQTAPANASTSAPAPVKVKRVPTPAPPPTY